MEGDRHRIGRPNPAERQAWLPPGVAEGVEVVADVREPLEEQVRDFDGLLLADRRGEKDVRVAGR